MKSLFAVLLVTLSLSLSTLCRAQGSLTPPPGVPAPTMKTLDQVEARKPVQSLSAAAPYTISQPGSYYLTGNITVATGDAIIVASDDVSLDLNGFTIRSTLAGSAAGSGVKVSGNHSRLTVRHGSIVSGTTVPASGPAVTAGFEFGIGAPAAILTQALVSEVHVAGIASYGIFLDELGVVERCTATSCGVTGIGADEVRDCTVSKCRGGAIFAYRNVTGCTGISTDGEGIYSEGTVTNCVGKSTAGNGLFASVAVTGCTGTSSSGSGLLSSGNVTNSSGSSTSGLYGLKAGGSASFSRGTRSGGTALQAANAIGCTADAGTIVAPLKSLGTP